MSGLEFGTRLGVRPYFKHVEPHDDPLVPDFDSSDFLIQGFALRYHRPFLHGDTVHSFVPGCVSQSLKENRIRLHLNHDETVDEFASTSDRLELLDSDEGLAIRLRLRDTESDRFLACLAASDFNGLSIGFTSVVNVRKDFAGVRNVLFHGRIELREISLVRRGAVSQAFVQTVRAKSRPSLAEEVKSGALLHEGAAVGVRRALEDLGKLT